MLIRRALRWGRGMGRGWHSKNRTLFSTDLSKRRFPVRGLALAESTNLAPISISPRPSLAYQLDGCRLLLNPEQIHGIERIRVLGFE